MHARVSLQGEAGVEETSADVAGMRARPCVDRQQVLAMNTACLERGAAHATHERPTRAVHRLVITQMTLSTHTQIGAQSCSLTTGRIAEHSLLFDKSRHHPASKVPFQWGI